MIKWNEFKTTHEEYMLIQEIVRRAIRLYPSFDTMSLSMDLDCAFNHVGLDLPKLLTSDKGDFLHDVNGIVTNINRITGNLENCFLPRASTTIN